MNAYTPAGLAALLAANAGTVLMYVAVAVTAGIALMFVYMGIKAGIRIFLGTANGSAHDSGQQAAMLAMYEEHSGWIDTSGYDMGMEAPDVGESPSGERHSGWIDTSGYDMGMDAPDVGTRPSR